MNKMRLRVVRGGYLVDLQRWDEAIHEYTLAKDDPTFGAFATLKLAKV
jgi:hypothetical protein